VKTTGNLSKSKTPEQVLLSKITDLWQVMGSLSKVKKGTSLHKVDTSEPIEQMFLSGKGFHLMLPILCS